MCVTIERSTVKQLVRSELAIKQNHAALRFAAVGFAGFQANACFAALVCRDDRSGVLGLPELKKAATLVGLSGEAKSDHALIQILKRNADSGEVRRFRKLDYCAVVGIETRVHTLIRMFS